MGCAKPNKQNPKKEQKMKKELGIDVVSCLQDGQEIYTSSVVVHCMTTEIPGGGPTRTLKSGVSTEGNLVLWVSDGSSDNPLRENDLDHNIGVVRSMGDLHAPDFQVEEGLSRFWAVLRSLRKIHRSESASVDLDDIERELQDVMDDLEDPPYRPYRPDAREPNLLRVEGED
jgi:hypothetical protein